MLQKNEQVCEHCGSCSAVCPTKSVLVGLEGSKLILNINSKTCTDCGKCVKICPTRALKLVRKRGS